MGKTDAEGRDGLGRATTDRRAFVAGVGAAAGLIGVASALSAQPGGGQRAGRQIKRSTNALSIEGAIRPVKIDGGASGELPEPILPGPAGPRPSTRKRLLDALAATEAGRALLTRIGCIGDGGLRYGASRLLQSTCGGDSLAQAYLAGITVTPSECSHIRGIGVMAAIEYWTYSAEMNLYSYESLVERQKCNLFGLPQEDAMPVIRFYLCTPGRGDSYLPYLVEMDVELEGMRAELNGQGVQFVESSDETRVALLQLTGSEGSYHVLDIYAGERQDFGHFCWLQAMVL